MATCFWIGAQDIERKKKENPEEALFKRNIAGVDEMEVIQWTMFVLRKLREEHGDKFLLHALNGMCQTKIVMKKVNT